MSLHRLSRRTVLRGLGAVVGLPLLEAMTPIRLAAAASDPARRPVRVAFLCVPNGKHMADWTPAKEGDLELKQILEPLSSFRSQISVLSGLTLDGANAHGDGGGDHARSCAAFLTGAHPKKTDGADIHNGTSIDQLIATKLGKKTMLPSLELGIDHSAQSGNCDSGYSCAYSSNIAWRTPTSPVAKEVDPAAVFDRMFGGGEVADQGKNRELRRQNKKSILDFVADDASELRRRLGNHDQRKLDEYLHAVRELEQRISGRMKVEKGTVSVDRPMGVPGTFAEHVKLMFDLTAIAFQTDATRVVSFMYANEGSNRSYKEIDVPDGHHDLSHHGNDAAKQSKISKINTFHVTLFAHLLERLSNVREDDKTLLDNCMIVYGSGIGDGNAHNHNDLPVLVAGRAGGAIETSRHLKFPNNTPLTNLYLSMLDVVGVKVPSFGDSTGRLDRLMKSPDS